MLKIVKVYCWQGINSKGQRTKGYLLTDQQRKVRAYLQSRGIIAYKIACRWRLISVASEISSKYIVHFSRQLANLLQAGFPLLKALDFLGKQQAINSGMQTLLLALKEDLENGASLSAAMSQYPRPFSKLYCSLIRVSEQSGDLSAILLQLANHQERLLSLKHKIQKALFYPGILVVVASLVFSVLMLGIVPQFEQLFLEVNTPLPYLTRAMINIARLLQYNFYWIVSSAILSGFSLWLSRKRLAK